MKLIEFQNEECYHFEFLFLFDTRKSWQIMCKLPVYVPQHSLLQITWEYWHGTFELRFQKIPVLILPDSSIFPVTWNRIFLFHLWFFPIILAVLSPPTFEVSTTLIISPHIVLLMCCCTTTRGTLVSGRQRLLIKYLQFHWNPHLSPVLVGHFLEDQVGKIERGSKGFAFPRDSSSLYDPFSNHASMFNAIVHVVIQISPTFWQLLKCYSSFGWVMWILGS